MHIMFVCTGNICRSPTAERLAASYVAEHGIPNLTTSSAGTRAMIGHPIHRDAAVVLEKLRGDSSSFAARQLTSKIASTADLIVTMTREHRDIVLEAAPRQIQRTFTLTEAARLASMDGAETLLDLAALRPRLGPNDMPDIVDPIGRSTEVFAAVGAQIAELLPPILEVCRRAAKHQ